MKSYPKLASRRRRAHLRWPRPWSLMVARQSSHLRSFAPDVAAKIEGWAVSAWSPTSAPLADALSTLIVNTDSGPGRSLLEQSRSSTDREIRRIAEEALAEMQG